MSISDRIAKVEQAVARMEGKFSAIFWVVGTLWIPILIVVLELTFGGK